MAAEIARQRWLEAWQGRMGGALRTLAEQDERMAKRMGPARSDL